MSNDSKKPVNPSEETRVPRTGTRAARHAAEEAGRKPTEAELRAYAKKLALKRMQMEQNSQAASKAPNQSSAPKRSSTTDRSSSPDSSSAPMTPEQLREYAKQKARERFLEEQRQAKKIESHNEKPSQPKKVSSQKDEPLTQSKFQELLKKAEKDKALHREDERWKNMSRKERIKEAFRHPLRTLYLSFTVPNPNYDPEAGNTILVDGKKKKNKERIISPKKTVRNSIIFVVLLALIFFIYAGTVILFAPKIDPANIYDEINTGSIIYDDSGKEVDIASNGQSRTIIEYEDLSEDTVNAFVALEDKTFWEHHGFNWVRMAGAVLNSFRGGGISGTSTITQQLARNVYLPNIKSQRSIKRKILEMYYAARIEQTLSKEEIFTAYVNSIYFGFGCYGIENAAETYFSKPAKELTLVESAALAAMPQSPDVYALIQAPSQDTLSRDTSTPITVNGTTWVANDIAKSRRDTCLSLMRDQGYIDESQYEEASSMDLTDFIDPTITSDDNTDTYFKDYLLTTVIEDLQEQNNMSYDDAYRLVYTGGLQIYSTMDYDAQKAVVDGFNSGNYFPSLAGISKDDDGNVIAEDGSITLYDYNNLITDQGNFVLSKSEYHKNDDGSITLLHGKRLNFYETEVNGATDYSVELKPSYTTEDGDFYIYPGGYISIPAADKEMNEDGDVTISADYLEANADYIKQNDDSIVFSKDLLLIQDKVIQPQAAMVITEVGTGEVKAIVGGRGATGEQLYNRAFSTRQPGSSIKPLTIYSAALQKSYELEKAGDTFDYIDPGNDKQGTSLYGDYLTASSIIVDEPITFDGKVWPKNSNNSFTGNVTMRQAMTNSINVCAVKIYEQLGSEYCANMAKLFGISTIDKSNSDDLGPAALALGGLSQGTTTYEMAEAYATFPNSGVRVENRVYTKVLDRNGKTLLTTKKTEHKVLDEGVSFIMTSMLQSVVQSGTGRNAAIGGVSVGGKTGTTDNMYDIWFNGFTPKYAASLWVGTDYNIQLSSMSSAASALWGSIMRNIPDITSGSYPKQPSNVVRKNGEYYTEGTDVGLVAMRKDEDEDEDKEKEEEKESTKKEDVIKPDDEQTDHNQPVTPPEGGDNPDSGDGSDEGDGEDGNTGGNEGGNDSSGNTGGTTRRSAA